MHLIFLRTRVHSDLQTIVVGPRYPVRLRFLPLRPEE
jgi:hypothetical protein